jgi:AmiR/NasT family two-component response regulator
MNREISILVAEDDYLISEEIIRCLKSRGYSNITKAADGQAAVDMTCSTRPDVILMDIEMPELDGIATAAEIQECCPTPIVILTAYESSDLLQKASAAGVSAYLNKPPRPEEMEKAITIAIARHADLMEVRRLNRELEQALAEVKTLRGIIPICSYCKKIRDDLDTWSQLEEYISNHSEAMFSHGICPKCYETQLAIISNMN